MAKFVNFLTISLFGCFCLQFNFSLLPWNPRAKRDISFEEITPQLKIIVESGYVIETFTTKKRLKCATKCLRNPECKSFTFCEHYCLLNSIGFVELQRNSAYDVYISPVNHCNIFGMKKEFVPSCEELGIARSIREDSNESCCRINQKRTDGTFLERHYFNASIETSTEFKGFTTRKCVTETALNGGYCKEENETKAVWVKLRHAWGWFTDSLDYCERLGGILYPDLDGDEKQIKFLTQLGGAADPLYWLGVTADPEWFLWKNLRGEKMTPDRMRWRFFVNRGINRAAQMDGRHLSIRNVGIHRCARAICQMMK